jgi:hypothetical protein
VGSEICVEEEREEEGQKQGLGVTKNNLQLKWVCINNSRAELIISPAVD